VTALTTRLDTVEAPDRGAEAELPEMVVSPVKNRLIFN
jgi:hypothetical protein